MNQNAANDELATSGPRSRSSHPPLSANATTTGVMLRQDVALLRGPPAWEKVELYVRDDDAGEDREWIEAYARAAPDFAGDLEMRRHTERPPWKLVESYLQHGEHAGWVEWYEQACPPFSALIEARRNKRQPPWEVVEDFLRSGEYREWVEEHAGRSSSFAAVLAAMHEGDDLADEPPPQGARVIPFRARPRST